MILGSTFLSKTKNKNKMCTHRLLKLYRKHIHGNFLAFQPVNMRYLRDPQANQMTDYRCLCEMVQGETCPFKSKIVTVLFIPVVGCDLSQACHSKRSNTQSLITQFVDSSMTLIKLTYAQVVRTAGNLAAFHILPASIKLLKLCDFKQW